MMSMKPVECINLEEAIRYLGYGEDSPDETMMEELLFCRDRLLKVMDPKFVFRVFPVERENDGIYVGNHQLKLEGESIREHLNGCELVSLGCATLSKGVDELIEATQKSDMLHSLLLDALANAAIEEVRLRLEEILSKEYPEYDINWQFGIGYGDLPLTIQNKFLDLIDAEDNIGVSANSSSILIPLKSVSGFIGLKKREASDLADVKNKNTKEKSNRTCGRNQCNTCSFSDHCLFKKRLS